MLLLAGLVPMWLAAEGHFGAMPLWQLIWLTLIGFSGLAWFDVASMTVSIANFPQHRGTMVGAFPYCLQNASAFMTV